MTEDKKAFAKQTLHDLLQKIAGERSDLTAGMDYQVPISFRINPYTFEPYTHASQKNAKYLVDLCIGKRVGTEIMPGVCIDVLENMDDNVMNNCNSKAHTIKSIHPQARYGMLLFAADNIPKEIVKPINSYTINIDFIEALGHVFDYGDKVHYVLKELVTAQLQSSDNIASAFFGDAKVRSMRKTYY